MSFYVSSIKGKESSNNYFIIDIVYSKNKKTRYSSLNYSQSNPIDLSDISASKKTVSIKLIKVYKDGNEIENSKVNFSYYFKQSSHTEILKSQSSTIQVPIKFLKASAYSTTTSVSWFDIREKSDISTAAANSDYVMPVIDYNYQKSINKTMDFAYLKNGLYGSKNKGILLSSTDIKLNNISIKNENYSWWTSEYKYINKRWRATSFILSIHYPFKYENNKNYSAYKFTIQRTKKGYLNSIKLVNYLTYGGSSTFGEVWNKQSEENLDQESSSYTQSWSIDDQFSYKYLITKPTISSIKNVGTQSLKIKWTKQADCDGFEIKYATKKDFSNKKTKKINSYKKSSATLKNLTSGKKYYIRMRAFGSVDEKKYYSKFSKTYAITVN